MKRMSNRLQGIYRSIVNIGAGGACRNDLGRPPIKYGGWKAGNENDAYLFLYNWYGKVYGVNLNSMMKIIYGSKKSQISVDLLLRLMAKFNDCNTVKAREFCMLHGSAAQLKRLMKIEKVNRSKIESLILIKETLEM